MVALQSAHRQLMEQVKSGARVSELPSVEVDDQAEAAAAPVRNPDQSLLFTLRGTITTLIEASILLQDAAFSS